MKLTKGMLSIGPVTWFYMRHNLTNVVHFFDRAPKTLYFTGFSFGRWFVVGFMRHVDEKIEEQVF